MKRNRKEYLKEYRIKNRDKINKRHKRYRERNREKIRIRARDWNRNNKDKMREWCREWYEKNKEYKKEYKKKWCKDNKGYKERQVKYMIERYKNNLNYRMKNRLRTRLRGAFKSYSKTGKCRTSDEYGIKYKSIIEHLGPCPGNMKDYDIDHIKPLCKFDFNNLNEIKRAFAPSNHQWLTAKENRSLGAKKKRKKKRL